LTSAQATTRILSNDEGISGTVSVVRGTLQRSHLSHGLQLAAVLSVVTAISVGCGGSSSSTSTKKSTASTASSQSSTAAATGALSGTWSGHYSGASQGTFTLTWRQSGARLTGTIKISTPSATYPISGTVNGSAIRFGTLGGGQITYTGSVSGSTMSGSYQAGRGGGSWNASKS